jgi:hypothetical protein
VLVVLRHAAEHASDTDYERIRLSVSPYEGLRSALVVVNSSAEQERGSQRKVRLALCITGDISRQATHGSAHLWPRSSELPPILSIFGFLLLFTPWLDPLSDDLHGIGCPCSLAAPHGSTGKHLSASAGVR